MQASVPCCIVNTKLGCQVLGAEHLVTEGGVHVPHAFIDQSNG